ncbi:phosphoribosylformylglycinamidine synthase [Candidatus Woesearchaeota archaeon]|nr:phosphoribosylformylglycinamidine synthase [Candidatus Woesearchaeota archaeon]
MAHRIERASMIPDTRFSLLQKKTPATIVGLTDIYTIDKTLSGSDLEKCVQSLTHPITEKSVVDAYHMPPAFDWAVEIGFLPGVTDNVAATVRRTVEDCLGKPFACNERVYTSQRLYLIGSEQDARTLAQLLANPLIQRFSVWAHDHPQSLPLPLVALDMNNVVTKIDLGIPDEDLAQLGMAGIIDQSGSRGPLALDLPSMKAIQCYFHRQNRQPTDVELEAIAQTWSEHCKHRLFSARIDDVDGLYQTYIKGATRKIASPLCVSVFTDNSGAIIFDDTYLVTHKVETHNSPSALGPFGGAVTGIVGVNRDALGFGKGAKPIINTYGFCFGLPEDKQQLFRAQNMPAILPQQIMEGVIEGVRAGGNCSGIPTPQGFMLFDVRYKAKPLVFVGTVGFMPRIMNGQPSHEKKAIQGDSIVMVGGRVGADGIHGATFSSQALHAGSPATAVQIGDPITQKKMTDALLEARDKGLYQSITDNGAGGLSCSVAEMARESNGCTVELDKVPTKYPGLAPWQLWISESQERMTLAVPPKKKEEFLSLMQRRGVEATVIGTFTSSGKCIVAYGREQVMDIDLDFLHDGAPKLQRQSTSSVVTHETPPPMQGSLTEQLLQLLGRHNVCSREFISVQYDHEVQGGSVIKPLQGAGRVNGDATVTRPLLDSYKGIALSQGVFPSYGDIDPYAMASCAIDAAIRNIIAVGGRLDRIALLDNFCWCSPDEPERLWQLKRAALACYETAVAYGTPFISGKDSMFNDFRGYDDQGNPVKLSIPPTLLISSLGIVDDVHQCVTMDFKRPGDRLYLVGKTDDESGGSEYNRMRSEQLGKQCLGNNVPLVHCQTNLPIYRLMHDAIAHGLLSSVHAPGIGGLAVSLTKCAVAGQLGALVDLSAYDLPAEKLLFSESAGRFLVTVPSTKCKDFEELLQEHAVLIGYVTNGPVAVYHDAIRFVDTDVARLEQAYKARFASW